MLPDLSLQLAQLLLNSLQLLLCLLSVCQPGLGLQSGAANLIMSAGLSNQEVRGAHASNLACLPLRSQSQQRPERHLQMFRRLLCQGLCKQVWTGHLASDSVLPSRLTFALKRLCSHCSTTPLPTFWICLARVCRQAFWEATSRLRLATSAFSSFFLESRRSRSFWAGGLPPPCTTAARCGDMSDSQDSSNAALTFTMYSTWLVVDKQVAPVRCIQATRQQATQWLAGNGTG